MDDREAFEELLQQWTGRDIEYHREYKTTGLDFAWECFRSGVERGRNDNA